jgi:hypothetical protein
VVAIRACAQRWKSLAEKGSVGMVGV